MRKREFWTASQVLQVRVWYEARVGKPLRIAELAAIVGKGAPQVSRKARELGLTQSYAERNPKHPRPSEAKYATPTESRAAIGRAARERIARNGHPRGMAGKRQKPEVLATLSRKAREWRETASPEMKADVVRRTQETLLSRYGTLSPGNDAKNNPYSRCRYGRRADLGDQFFRSRWEANYARILEWLKTRGEIRAWEYEAETFWFERIRRGVRSYKPDFRVTENDGRLYYVEVKGWMDPKSKTKIARMARYHPTVDLRVIGEREYRALSKQLAGAIPEWETDERGRL